VKQFQILAVFMLLLTYTTYSACSQSTNDNVTTKLDALVDEDKARLIDSTRELVMIKSVNARPQTGAPFGQGTAEALDKALQIARDLGFNTTNQDGYIGYAEYGQGADYVGVLAHLDVVAEGDGWTYPPYKA
jgi:succinyl-diaminopimelate desuccinylase